MTGMVHDNYSADQIGFGQEIKRFLAKSQPPERVRAFADDPMAQDNELWQRAAKELDLLGLMVPEELGGSGFGFAEVSLVLTAAGAHLTSWPYLSSAVLATHCLLRSESGAALLPGLTSGEVVATVATSGEGSWRLGSGTVRAEQTPEGSWSLTGTESFVTDAHAVDLILVVGHAADGPHLFVVRTASNGLAVEVLPSLDRTRPLCRIDLASCAAEEIGGADVVAALDASLPVIAAAALVQEQAGGAAQTVELTSAYANTRRQFGRTIGSFQAVKHKCADQYIRSETSAAFAEALAFAVDAAVRSGELGDEVRILAAAAAVHCGDAFIRNAEDMIQVHGGIGFTWEHDANLYLRRAASTAQLFGGRDRHLDLLAAQITHGSLLDRGEYVSP